MASVSHRWEIRARKKRRIQSAEDARAHEVGSADVQEEARRPRSAPRGAVITVHGNVAHGERRESARRWRHQTEQKVCALVQTRGEKNTAPTVAEAQEERL